MPEEDRVIRHWEEISITGFVQTMKSRGLDPDISPGEYLRWWEERLREMKGS
jgi:hypothetical protein